MPADHEPDTVDFTRCAKVFAEARDHVVDRGFTRLCGVSLHFDPKIDKGANRDFAYCVDNPRPQPPSIHIGARLEVQGLDRIRGVIWHEFGHAIDFAYNPQILPKILRLNRPLPETPERRADVIAGLVFPWRVMYDAGDVQVAGPHIDTKKARAIRPGHLPV